MRILLAGATGVLGQILVPHLVDEGHEVLGLSRRTAGARQIRRSGAQADVCDVYDLERLTSIVSAFGPDAVIHQLTDLPDDPALIDDAANARIRTEGTDNLLQAARRGGATRFLVQSVAWPLLGVGGEAVAYLEREVLRAGGVVIRYGRLYGPGTYYPFAPPESPRIHVEEAAVRTVALMTTESGIYRIAD